MNRFFVYHPVFAWVIALFIALFGVIALRLLPIESYPSVAPPSLNLAISYNGADAEVMDRSVTAVIEKELNGVDNFLYMASTSRSNGTAQITVTFKPGTNLDVARTQVQDRLSRAEPRLPQEVQALLHQRQARFYIINAAKLARECRLGARINTVMQMAFFHLTKILPGDSALMELQGAIAKSYSSKGQDLVERNWQALLDAFYEEFRHELAKAESDEGMRPNQPVPTNIDCPSCGRQMQIRTASTGVFLGCSGYNLPPKERCKTTIDLIPGEEAVAEDAGEEAETDALRAKRRCPKCGTAMDNYLIDETRKLHICGNSPDCDGYEVESGKFKIKGYDGPLIECDKCGSDMQLKSGRFGKYFGCTNSECKNTRKLLRSGEVAPPKMDPIPMPELACQKVEDHYVLRDGASGLFLAASKFPKNRETRPPLVQELKAHADELPEKYHFLLKAPSEDPDGRPAQIRYSRKNKEQYVMTDEEGKATGWKATYEGGKWHVEDKRK